MDSQNIIRLARECKKLAVDSLYLEAEEASSIGWITERITDQNKAAILELASVLPTKVWTIMSAETLAEILAHIHSRQHEFTQLLSYSEECSKASLILLCVPQADFTFQLKASIDQCITTKTGEQYLNSHIRQIGNTIYWHYLVLHRANSFIEELEKDIRTLLSSWHDRVLGFLRSSNIEVPSINFEQLAAHNCSAQEAAEKLRHAIVALDKQEVLYKFSQNESRLELFREGNQCLLEIYHPLKSLDLNKLLQRLITLRFQILEEKASVISIEDKECWYYKITLSAEILLNTEVFNRIEQVFRGLHDGKLPDDDLNILVTHHGFGIREMQLCHALHGYLTQAILHYSDAAKAVLANHLNYIRLIYDIFAAKFHPQFHNIAGIEGSAKSIEGYLLGIANSEDKILRPWFHLITAISRTNFYQTTDTGKYKDYISFKINAAKLPGLLLPIPHAEIYVHSRKFEGVHLRAGKVARGGIRWSDRAKDYRTEVLGLMKSQVMKNSLIVPTGAKGGFYVKNGNGVECYQQFLRGLLDLTDNKTTNGLKQPKNTVIYDGEDPYLVVAADKGTAKFSDYANQISKEYDFWLGDAFASGGSNGYDHKKMGITARGAWISAVHHLQHLHIDMNNQPITLVGIGDMSGDVFGNGLIYSNNLKLVAAFDHRHIFIDPDPDPINSHLERVRLFNLPSSSWADYNPLILSAGGKIYSRHAKHIELSRQAQHLLNLEHTIATPNAVIRAILCAKVDLLWIGGIGTYVKSSTENHTQINDSANDDLRCNGNEIRARVVAEGGNLGFSQLGRIEYSRKGGLINSDFLDNSAGVDCSDHEVNIKIAFAMALAEGQITLEERNQLLFTMTEEVAESVLLDNYNQNMAVTISRNTAPIKSYHRLIQHLEDYNLLNRSLEFLPSDPELIELENARSHLTRPELAVLLSYSKMWVYRGLLNSSTSLEFNTADNLLLSYFPKTMQEKFRANILEHPLRAQIIASVLANDLINHIGGAVVNDIIYEGGFSLFDIIQAYLIASELLNIDELWNRIRSLPPTQQLDLSLKASKSLVNMMLWLLNNNLQLQYHNEYKQKLDYLRSNIDQIHHAVTTQKLGVIIDDYHANGFPVQEANLLASLAVSDMLIAIVRLATEIDSDLMLTADRYFELSHRLQLDWLREYQHVIGHAGMQDLASRIVIRSLYDKHEILLGAVLLRDGFDDVLVPALQPYMNLMRKIRDNQGVNLDLGAIVLADKYLAQALIQMK